MLVWAQWTGCLETEILESKAMDKGGLEPTEIKHRKKKKKTPCDHFQGLNIDLY